MRDNRKTWGFRGGFSPLNIIYPPDPLYVSGRSVPPFGKNDENEKEERVVPTNNRTEMERHVRSEGKIYSNFLVPVNFQKTVPGFGKFATLCCCNEAHENFNLWLARSHRLLNQID